MAHSRRPIISHQPASTLPSRTPGPLGTNDGAEPFVVAAVGDTRGPLGYNDHGDPSVLTQSLRDFFNFDYRNVSFATSANKKTQEIIELGPDNKFWSSWGAIILVPKVKERVKKMPWKGWEQHIEDVYNIVEELKCGNCGEYAAVAFTLLKKQNVRPIDFVGVRSSERRRRYTHNFVVIGRCSKKTEPKNEVIELPEPKLWGNAAVVCDAYHDKVYPAIFLNVMRPGDRFRDSLCRLG